MSKRDVMLSLLDESPALPYTPAAFFQHFPPEYRTGQAAVDKHLEFFRATGMDFVKVQYEKQFPALPSIQKPADWANMPRYDLDFYEAPLAVIRGLVQAAKADALVIVTLYSPFMQAKYTVGNDLLMAHLNEAPDAVARGLAIITESMLDFVRACIVIGVDGFYHSTQGGEAGRYQDATTFTRCIKPYDLALAEAAAQGCIFNILHVCDYQRDYDNLTAFLDYPGHVVSCPAHVGGKAFSPAQAAALFKRPCMGGLDRKGALATGSPADITRAAESVLRDAPARFILGADCTVPNDTPWANLRTAVEAAHRHTPAKA